MPDRRHSADQPGPETDTPAFTFYMADLQRLEEIMPEPDLRQDLAAGQLGLVMRAARRVTRRYPGADLDILDLIQEGNLALLQAVDEWLDCPPRDARFTPSSPGGSGKPSGCVQMLRGGRASDPAHWKSTGILAGSDRFGVGEVGHGHPSRPAS